MSQCTPISGNTPISGCTPTYLTRYWPYNGVPEYMEMHSLPQGTPIYANAFPNIGIPQYMGTHPKIMEYPSSLGINHGRQTSLCSFSVLANCRTHANEWGLAQDVSSPARAWTLRGEDHTPPATPRRGRTCCLCFVGCVGLCLFVCFVFL